MRLEAAAERRAADADNPGDLVDGVLACVDQLAGDGELVVGEERAAAAAAAACAGGLEAGVGAFADEVALELGE